MASFDSNPEGYDSDVMIARMLQMQFDKEHDEVVKRTEAKYNGTSKGNIIAPGLVPKIACYGSKFNVFCSTFFVLYLFAFFLWKFCNIIIFILYSHCIIQQLLGWRRRRRRRF